VLTDNYPVLSQSLLLFTATTAGLMIPLLPGGIGTFEAAGIYVLKGVGYGFTEALVLSVALHVCQMLFTFLASMVIVSSERIGVGALVAKLRALGTAPVDNNTE